VSSQGIEIDVKIPQYKRAAVATIKLKHLNREIQQALEQKRNEVEKEKEEVEMLKLKLENVLYKKAYLQREIRVLKDFSTPELNAVEKEIGRPLAAVDSSSSGALSNIEMIAKDVMNKEIIEREETSKRLDQLTAIKVSKEEVLDKKRKFLDDIPLRMSLVKASTADIQAQFDTYKNGLNAIDESSQMSIEEGEEEEGVEVEGDDAEGISRVDNDTMKEEGEEDEISNSKDAMDETAAH
jgi:Fms-interacting protein/Thoc5